VHSASSFILAAHRINGQNLGTTLASRPDATKESPRRLSRDLQTVDSSPVNKTEDNVARNPLGG